ncbi:NSP5 [Rotavirus I]|uniref:NSP5 n=1 Tax=Rotavirus I TaxID=1637496 RepID=A0A0E3JVA4_9REOV|nr:NSP5 [Rotavirus I]AKA63272.1 NSP5 [Rotavirus I]
MADDSSFTLTRKKTNKKEKEKNVTRGQRMNFEEEDVSVAGETDTKSIATESESSTHSYEDYERAYRELTKDSSSEQVNLTNTAIEQKNLSRFDERKNVCDPTLNLLISQMKAEIDQLKVKVSDQSLDNAYNKILANVEILTSSQKKALLMALASSMK